MFLGDSHKTLHANVRSSLVYNCQGLEANRDAPEQAAGWAAGHFHTVGRRSATDRGGLAKPREDAESPHVRIATGKSRVRKGHVPYDFLTTGRSGKGKVRELVDARAGREGARHV